MLAKLYGDYIPCINQVVMVEYTGVRFGVASVEEVFEA